jgi:hypothetical protein
VFVQAGQASEQPIVETWYLVALFSRQIFQIKGHDQDGTVAINIRTGNVSYIFDVHFLKWAMCLL